MPNRRWWIIATADVAVAVGTTGAAMTGRSPAFVAMLAAGNLVGSLVPKATIYKAITDTP
jgi:hypothetical protein